METLKELDVVPTIKAITTTNDTASKRSLKKLASRIRGIEIQNWRNNPDSNHKEIILGQTFTGWEEIKNFESTLENYSYIAERALRDPWLRYGKIRRALLGTALPIFAGGFYALHLENWAFLFALGGIASDPIGLGIYALNPLLKRKFFKPADYKMDPTQSQRWVFESVNIQYLQELVDSVTYSYSRSSSLTLDSIVAQDINAGFFKPLKYAYRKAAYLKNKYYLKREDLNRELEVGTNMAWGAIDRLLIFDPETNIPTLTVVVRSSTKKPLFEAAKSPASEAEQAPALQPITVK